MIAFGVGLCAAYLAGSIPTGVWVGRLKGVDVRRHGSGNVGATNVARVAGKLPGILVLAVDVAKGWAPVALLAPWLARTDPALAADWVPVGLGAAAVAGHIWNPFLQFQGGKGVATALGVLLALDLRIGLGSALVWLMTALSAGYVSVASIAAAMASPFLMILMAKPASWVLGTIAVALCVIARHRPNILRLLQGEEHRIRSSRRP